MMQKGQTLILILVGIFIIAVVASGAYYFGKSQVPKSQPQNPVITSQTPQPTFSPTPSGDETANWKTYTNTKYRYSIKYPSTWVYGISSKGDGMVTFDSDAERLARNVESGIFTIIVYPGERNVPLEGDGRNVVVERKTVTMSGRSGEQALLKDAANPDSPGFILASINYNGNTYSFNLSDTTYLSTYEKMIKTFIFSQ